VDYALLKNKIKGGNKMAWFGKEENVEKAQSKAIEENINRDARKAEAQAYQVERRKVKIKQAQERAVRRANAPSLGQSLISGMGSFASSINKQSPHSKVSSGKPRRVKQVKYIKKGKVYRKVTTYRTVKPRAVSAQTSSSPISSMFSSPSFGMSSETKSSGGLPDVMGLYGGKKKGKGGMNMSNFIRY